jgi:phasin family protein
MTKPEEDGDVVFVPVGISLSPETAEPRPVGPTEPDAGSPTADRPDSGPEEPPATRSAPPTFPESKPVIRAPVASRSAGSAAPAPPISNWTVIIMSKSLFMGYDQLIAFGQSNVEAMLQTNQVFAKAIQEIGKEIASLAQAEFERVATAGREALAAKSPQEALKVQTAFATGSLERLLATSTKLGELNVKLATDTMVPITAKVGAALEKVTARAA